jgi:hypothetical protein
MWSVSTNRGEGARSGVRPKLAAVTPPLLRNAVRRGLAVSRRVGYARARWPRPFGTRPAIQLAVCAIFKNEARYLAEWVTFHRLMGVQHFSLYNNGSADDWVRELIPELDAGIVEVIPWPGTGQQLPAYQDCLNRHRRHARWVAFIDLDEFLFSPTGRTLPDVLEGFRNSSGVVVNWRIYGPNGHDRRPPGLVMESYLARARDDHPMNLHVKSIVYPRKTPTVGGGAHVFHHYGALVGEDGRATSGPWRYPPTAELLRINHYYSRSLEDWRTKLSLRSVEEGDPRNRGGYELPSDEVRDDAILAYLPPLTRALKFRPAPA